MTMRGMRASVAHESLRSCESQAGMIEIGKDMAGQPIKPRDHERGVVASTFGQGGGELGAVGVPLAALDLLKLGEQGNAMCEARDGGALSFQSRPAFALAFG
jgi:hypothetical protein